MTIRRPGFAVLPAMFSLCALFVPSESAAAAPSLERDVLPLLQKHCMGCHGGLKQKGGLDLRTLPTMLAGGDEGPAVVAGKPEESVLWTRVADDEMPKGEKKLSADEKSILRAWIDAGLPSLAAHARTPREPLLARGEKHDAAAVAHAIDAHVERRLADARLAPATLADDAEFLRRAFLDLAGRVPASDQAAAFLDDAAPAKRAALIDALLAAPEFGERIGRAWRDWICPPELPSDMNSGTQPITQSRDLGVWFAERFNANESWDAIVRQILTVEGEIKDSPQMIFFGLVGQNARATPDGSARSTASLFMGVQIGCAQCHDDPYRDWAQSEFWSLAAFFAGVQADFRKIEEKAREGRVTIPDSAFKNAGTKVPAAFLRGGEVDASESARWRTVFVDWLTSRDNPFFARAFVNRLWFTLFARGIVHPVDDFRELNPPTHPELLELLADEFVASGFDVKHLLRCICASRAYQRTSRVEPDLAEDERTAQAALFGRAEVRVMTADMLLDSLERVYRDPKLDLRTLEKGDDNASGESAPVGDAYLEFHRAFETNEEDATDFTHGIPQMLTFINHPRLLEGSPLIDELLADEPLRTPERTVERLYLATLSRRPTGEELDEAARYVSESVDVRAAYRDVLWMLVNRSEFICVR